MTDTPSHIASDLANPAGTVMASDKKTEVPLLPPDSGSCAPPDYVHVPSWLAGIVVRLLFLTIAAGIITTGVIFYWFAVIVTTQREIRSTQLETRKTLESVNSQVKRAGAKIDARLRDLNQGAPPEKPPEDGL